MQGIKDSDFWASMCAALSHADHKVIYLHSASSSAIWFHFSVAVITLDPILEHKRWWVPYEKLPLNWESSGSLKAVVTACAFYQPVRKKTTNLVYFYLTKAWAVIPSVLSHFPGWEVWSSFLFLLSELGVPLN